MEGRDISPVWQRCHEHLRPFADPVDSLVAEHLEPCPLCREDKALRIKAHLRFGEQNWYRNADLFYCHACGHYSLPDTETLVSRSEGPVTAVDARLWSRSPTFLNLEPTTRCNFDCWYCIGRSMEQGDLSVEDFKRILDNFPDLRVLALVGEGEPFLNKGFFDMARLARERGIRVVTTSNGSVFSQSVVEKICEAGVTYISVSIDSIDPANFAASRLGGDLDKVWRGLERLRAWRDQQGYSYPVLGLKGTLFSHTQDELPAIIAEARQRGVDVLEGFQTLNTKDSYIQIYPPEQLAELQDVNPIRQKIEQAYLQRDVPETERMPSVQDFMDREGLYVSNIGKPNGLRRNCDEEWIYSLLSGDITPCCQIKQPMNPAWNLREQAISEILAEKSYENLRFNLWNGIFMPECSGCWKVRDWSLG